MTVKELADFWEGAYRAETTWFGEAGLESLTPELEAQGYSEDDVLDAPAAIILQPTN